jgi:hypothetical protein
LLLVRKIWVIYLFIYFRSTGLFYFSSYIIA